jgi:hypothetical protein
MKTASSSDLFYSRLPVNEIPLSDLLTEDHLFFRVPDSWHVIITDVRKSTEAVANGQHETVNLVATGSIVAVLNIAYKADLSIPFFFGGDGATFIIPPSIFDAAMKALLQHQENTLKNFSLSLRVGQVPVQEIYAADQELKLTKLRASQLFSIPVMLGNGLAYAEKIIKAADYSLELDAQDADELDMTGMECRWDKIKPPASFDEVVSLLVLAQPGQNQALAFREVVKKIDAIYGDPEKRKPITVSQLKLKATVKKISREMKAKLGGYKPLYLIQKLATTLLGSFYFKTKQGKTYLQQLVELSDTLVIDGRINTVISGTAEQRKELETALGELEEQGLIWYGLFVSRESVLSCYVRNMHEKHIHFVDGSDGGYTRAAIMLKKKLAASNVHH